MASALEITPDQLEELPRVIGKTKNGIKVFHIRTKGGYHLVAKHAGNGVDILGVGSHVAIAKHLATMKNPDIELELTKSEESDVSRFREELPRWEAETLRWRSLNK